MKNLKRAFFALFLSFATMLSANLATADSIRASSFLDTQVQLNDSELDEIEGRFSPIIAMAVVQGGRLITSRPFQVSVKNAARIILNNKGRYKGVLAKSSREARKIAKQVAKTYKKETYGIAKVRVIKERGKGRNRKWHYHVEYKNTWAKSRQDRWKRVKTHIWY